MNGLTARLSRLLVLVIVTVLLVAAQAQAEPLSVTITPGGDEVFAEGTVQSGEITWRATEDLTLIPIEDEAPAALQMRFGVHQYCPDPDNIPVGMEVTDLQLYGWTSGSLSQLSWKLTWMPNPLDGQVIAGSWSITGELDSQVLFHAGDIIATASWSTTGNDVDNFVDSGAFEIQSSVDIFLDFSPWGPTSISAYDAKLLNPEHLPEPTAVAALWLSLLLKRRRTG